MLSAEKAKTLTEKYKGKKSPLPIIHIFKDNAVDIFVYVLHIHSLSKPVEIIFVAIRLSIVLVAYCFPERCSEYSPVLMNTFALLVLNSCSPAHCLGYSLDA